MTKKIGTYLALISSCVVTTPLAIYSVTLAQKTNVKSIIPNDLGILEHHFTKPSYQDIENKIISINKRFDKMIVNRDFTWVWGKQFNSVIFTGIGIYEGNVEVKGNSKIIKVNIANGIKVTELGTFTPEQSFRGGVFNADIQERIGIKNARPKINQDNPYGYRLLNCSGANDESAIVRGDPEWATDDTVTVTFNVGRIDLSKIEKLDIGEIRSSESEELVTWGWKVAEQMGRANNFSDEFFKHLSNNTDQELISGKLERKQTGKIKSIPPDPVYVPYSGFTNEIIVTVNVITEYTDISTLVNQTYLGSFVSSEKDSLVVGDGKLIEKLIQLNPYLKEYYGVEKYFEIHIDYKQNSEMQTAKVVGIPDLLTKEMKLIGQITIDFMVTQKR